MGFNNKTGKTDFLSIVLIGLAIWLVIGSQGTIPGQIAGQQPGDVTIPSGTNVVTVVGAPCTQATTLTASILRRYTDVAQTSENVTVVQNGVEKTTIAHAGTTTVQSGPNADLLDLYPAFDKSTTFYAQHLRGKLETCTGSATTGDPSFKFVSPIEDGTIGLVSGNVYSDGPNKIVQIDTAPTFTIVNDGQANQNPGIDGVGANLTIGQGSTASVTVTVLPTAKQGIGAIGGNVIACQYPSAVYDSSDAVQVVWDGQQLSKTDKKPSNQRFPLIGANNSVTAFAAPPIDATKKSKFEIGVTLKADSNHDPSGPLDRINCTIFDTDYYKTQVGKFVLDTESRDDNTDVGGSNANYDFVIGVI